MTIEELLGKSAAELIAMSDAELNEYLSPYFKFCRPENTLTGFTKGVIKKDEAFFPKKKHKTRSLKELNDLYNTLLNKK